MIEILATWRLTNLIVDKDEVGPFNVLSRIRYAIGVRYDDLSEPYGTTEVSKAASCVWCTSIWVAMFIAIIRRKVSIANVLAWSVGAILINERMKRW